MKKKRLIEFLNSSSKISEKEVAELETMTKAYPYFQAGKAIYLKSLKDNNDYKYNKVLKETAALTNDRALLFDFITEFSPIPKTTSASKIEITHVPEEKLDIDKPLEFTKKETHSFNEWLQLSNLKPIQRKTTTHKTPKKLDKIDLIDRFIEANPTIQTVDKDAKKGKKIKVVLEDQGLMTETLAKVYLEQKKYGSAIKAYQILSLKYPEKSGFFADQIKKIEYLKNKS